MTFKDVYELTCRYGKCPECGCETVGNGTGTIEVDTKIGFFKRTCACGWYIEIKENS